MIQLDFTQPPFDVLTLSERESLKKHTQVRYLAKDQSLSADESNYFFVVLKGRIELSLNGAYIADYGATSHRNDWFDGRQSITATSADRSDVLMSATTAQSQTLDIDKQSNSSQTKYAQYRALEDSLLLQIEPEALDKLSAQNRLVRNVLSGELSERMQALNQRQRKSSLDHTKLDHARLQRQAESQQLMLQPITTVSLINAPILSDATTLIEAANVMTEQKLKHVLINRSDTVERHPTQSTKAKLGILTETDICRAVCDLVDMNSTLCSEYANYKLRTISEHQDVGDAMQMMIRYRIQRLPVINDQQQVIGTISQSNLLGFLNQHSQVISNQIDNAEDITTLHAAVEQIGEYIRTQHDNGIKIGVISRMVQTLNAQVFTRLWQLLVPPEVFDNTCVIVMGSEGRGEQIMRTDQDNALIIRNGFKHPQMSDYAEQFNQTLASMGYPLCDGQIMMSNPLWRQSLNRFKSQVSNWFSGNDPNHAIWLSSVLDATYVCGDESLLLSLREHFKLAHKHSDPMFLRSFAKAALQFGDVNQWWLKFMPLIGKPLPQDIDLKKAGLFPIVHGVRAMALEHDLFDSPNTKSRLTALAKIEVMTPKRAETLNEALEFFMAQRLNVALQTDDKFARQVDPTTLSSLERDVLKECLNVVKGFKYELRQHYQLDVG